MSSWQKPQQSRTVVQRNACLRSSAVVWCRTPSWKDGSTAVVLFLINDTVYVANLGDSKVRCLSLNDRLYTYEYVQNCLHLKTVPTACYICDRLFCAK